MRDDSACVKPGLETEMQYVRRFLNAAMTRGIVGMGGGGGGGLTDNDEFEFRSPTKMGIVTINGDQYSFGSIYFDRYPNFGFFIEKPLKSRELPIIVFVLMK
jgi:hypothetical protein